MIATENPDLYEVTCLNCRTTKSYFTAQGVSFFKLNHEGHNVKVKEPGTGEVSQEKAPEVPEVTQAVPVPEVDNVVEQKIEETIEVPKFERALQTTDEGPVRLSNLVVDVVDEEGGRAIKVFGIGGGHERFSKSFEMHQLDELNGFLESGLYYDDSARVRYTWTPDKVDLSTDVVKMIDGGPVAQEVRAEPVAVEPKLEEAKEPEPSAEVPKVTELKIPASVSVKSGARPLPEVVLLGKRSYIQEGEEYSQESVRISKVLRKFRWNIEPPYVIGAIFDDLMCIQSQSGTIKNSLIEEVEKSGYTFVAIEAPGGCLTAWFRRKAPEVQPDGETLELSQPSSP
jgi:hypothetical protein